MSASPTLRSSSPMLPAAKLLAPMLLASMLLVAMSGCQDGSPDRAPDVLGRIFSLHLANGRVDYMIVNRLQRPEGLTEIRVNVDSKARVVWYTTGRAVFSQEQNVRVGMTVRAFASSGLMESDPPQMNVSRVELSNVADVR